MSIATQVQDLISPLVTSVSNLIKRYQKQLLQRFDGVENTLGDVTSELGEVPAKVAAGLLDGAPEQLRGVIDHASYVGEGMKFIGAFSDKVAHKVNEFDDEDFRGKLQTFLSDMEKIAAQIPRILIGGAGAPGLSELSSTLVDAAPKLMLLPLSEAMRGIDQWEKLPKQILTEVEKLPSSIDIAQLQQQLAAGTLGGDYNKNLLPDAQSAFVKSLVSDATLVVLRTLRVLILLVNRVIKLIKDAAARDLSVVVNVAAGGGTVVSSHPTRWGPAVGEFTLDLVLIAVDEVLYWRGEVKAAIGSS